ncbi:MAG TPA: SOS response-associated peptidase family protein, partial [Acidimicrobiales bacterium]
MCGRFALYTPPARVARYFQATLAEATEENYSPSWNVAPTDQVLGVRERPDPDGGPPTRLLMSFRWGLVPWWSKDAKGASRLINARCETVANKASFR